MADKIIIDGINVEDIEKCEFCTRICKNTKETTPLCKLFGYCEGVDCYYKQLKRKEQECEELKSENFTFEELIKVQEKQLDEIDRFLLTFCASCEHFEGKNFGMDLKDDTVCKKYCPNLFRKTQERISSIINKAKDE